MSDVPKPLGLHRRNGVYSFRVRVPKDLVGVLGPEYKRSLGTRSLPEAKELRNLAAVAFDDLCRTTRAKLAGVSGAAPPKPLAPAFLNKVRVYVEQTSAEAKRRMSEANRGAGDRQACIENIAELAAHYRDPNDQLTEFDVSRLCSELFPREFEALGPDQKAQLYELVRRAALEIETRALAWLQGRFRAESFDHLFTPALANTEPQRSAKELQSLSNEFFAEYEKTSRTSAKNLERIKAGLDLINEFFGPDAVVADLTLERCREFRDALTRMPSNRTKKLSKSTLEQAMQQVDAGRLKPLARNTQATKLGVLKMLINEAHRRDLVRRDFGPDLKPSEEKTDPRLDRSPFSEGDLSKIFCSEHYPAPPLRSDIDAARYWIPLICLYSGMRLNEAAQLEVDDIKTSGDGVVYFDIAPGPSKRLKSRSARRIVPIHKRLLEWGILEFAAQHKASGDEKLFRLARSGHGYYSDGIQKWFSRTLMKNCGVARDRKSFHSIRHSATDALRRAEAPESIIKSLLGWSGEKTMLNVYGSGYSPPVLQKWIDKIEYPCLS